MNNPLGVSPSNREPQRPKAEVDNPLRDLQNSSYPTKAEFNNCFIIHSKYFPVLKKEFRYFTLCFFRSDHKYHNLVLRFSRSTVQ